MPTQSQKDTYSKEVTVGSLFDVIFSVLFILAFIGCLIAWLNDVGQGHPEPRYRRPDRPTESAGCTANLVPPELPRVGTNALSLPADRDGASAA